MNYREKQLRSLINKNYISKSQHLQETQQLQKARAQDLIDTLQKDLGIDFLLDYSEIVKKLKGRSVEEVLEEENNKDKETNRLQNLLNDTINLLGSEDISNLSDLSNLLQGQTLKELVQHKDLLNQKIKDQAQALLNLAKQKIKGQKEADHLMNILETDFSKKQIEWETKQEQTKKEREKERNQWTQQLAQLKEQNNLKVTELKQDIQQKEQTIIGLNNSYEKLEKSKNQELKELQKNQEQVNQQHQQELTNALKSVSDLQSENKQLIQSNQEQLRKINVLFDIKAVDYDTIDFNGLYSLLETIARERERERERAKSDGSKGTKKSWWS